MKKNLTILTLLLSLCLVSRPAAAQETVWLLGDKISYSSIADGMKIILEGASASGSLECYLTAPPSDYYKQPFAGSETISAETVWIVESAGTTNEYLANAPEWRFKNQSTGKYLACGFPKNDTESSTYGARGLLSVDNAEDATKFCVFSCADPENGVQENLDYQDGAWDADSWSIRFTHATSTGIDTLCLDQYWNHNWYFWPHKDTNAANAYEAVEKSDSKSILQWQIDAYGTDILSSYAYGTNPGEISSQEIYQNFYNAYSEAVYALELDNSTEEQYAEMLTTLRAAKEAIDDSTLINPLTDGYYYFVTSNTAFSQNKAIYHIAGEEGLNWKDFDETDFTFIWEIHKVDNGYSVQNVSTGVYLNKAASVASSQVVYVSKTFETPSVFTRLNQAGEFHISDSVDYVSLFPYHMKGHQEGAGVSGNIVLYKQGAGTPSSWYVRRVSSDIEQQIKDNKGSERLATQLEIAKTSITGMKKNQGELVGQWQADAVTKLQSTIDEAEALVANGGSNDEFLAMAEKVQAQRDSTANSRNKAEDGKYYRFVNAYPGFFEQQGVEKAICSMRDAFQWRNLEATSLCFIFKATANEDGSYYFQNVSTGKYMGQANNTNNSQTIYQKDDPCAINLVNYNDSVYEFKIVPRDVARSYHPKGHSNGAGINGYLVNWDTTVHGQSAWYVREVPTDSVQLMLFDRLIKKAEDKADAIYVYEPDLTQPAGTAASQYYCNNMETKEGSYAALCDGDDELDENGKIPIFHSMYSNGESLVDELHYLRLYSETGLPEKFVLTFTNRTGQKDQIRPREIMISVSNDAETWTDLVTLSHNVAVFEPENDYVSPEINAGASYKYVKMTVLHTTGYDPTGEGTGQTDKYGHQFFALTEFNVYPSNGLSPAAQVNDPAVKAQADLLNTAIEKAKSIYNNGSVTDADFDELQAAIDAFNAIWKDTTLYTAKVAEVNILKENLTAGTNVGQVTSEALSTFESDIAIPANISPVYKLSRAEMEAYIAEMDSALAKVKAAMVMPDSKIWYFIMSAEDNTESSTNGWWILQSGRQGIDEMYNKDSSYDPTSHINNVWVFENDGAGKFYIRNVGSGMYQTADNPSEGGYIYNAGVTGALPEAHSMSLIPLGNGQFAFKSNAGNFYMYANATSAKPVTWQTPDEDVTDLTGTKFAFEFSEASGAADEINRPESGMRLGTFQIRVHPTALAHNPTTTIDGDDTNPIELEIYEITGKVVNEEGTITAINLSKITADDPVVEAGKPLIVYAPGDYSANTTTDKIYFPFAVDGDVAQALDDSINGLIGLFEARTFLDSTKAGFYNDSISPVTVKTKFANQRGYIDPSQITDIEGATNDLTVYVMGAGLLNDINNVVVVDNRDIVNVYSIDGVLLRKNVTRANATNGLAKGIYIVGKEKVLVK